MAFTCKFVDSIAASPAVRLDVNDGTTWRLLSTSTFRPPEPKRARVSTLLADGAIYPASAYEDRMLGLHFAVLTSSSDLAAAEVQKLARELDRQAGNILQYQPNGATHPVFFRTQRLGLDAIQMFRQSDRLRVEVLVPAEPFALGVKETLSSATVNNDPAAGTNPMYWDITDVKGDVETPLQLRFTYATPFGGLLSSALGIRRRGTPADTPFVLQAESMTASTDTSIQANDTVMSGAGQNYMRCTFATATLINARLRTTLFPATASVDARGTYRVFLRHRQSVANDVMQIQVGYGRSDGQGGDFFIPTVTLPSDTKLKWTDLGLLSIPAGQDSQFDGYSGTEIAARGISLAVRAARSSGTGNLDFDALLFVPADDQFANVVWPAEANIDFVQLDGPLDQPVAFESTTEVRSTGQPITWTGATPKVSPGVTNRLFWLLNTGPANQADDITHSTTINAAYWPRYLHVRPPSS